MAISFERAGAPPIRTMSVEAHQNFEKTTIYSPDALEMFLTCFFLAVLNIATATGMPALLDAYRRAGHVMMVERPDKLLAALQG